MGDGRLRAGAEVSLRLGHTAGLTPHRGVIQHRVAASLLPEEGLREVEDARPYNAGRRLRAGTETRPYGGDDDFAIPVGQGFISRRVIKFVTAGDTLTLHFSLFTFHYYPLVSRRSHQFLFLIYTFSVLW